jgi:hypothetical protein
MSKRNEDKDRMPFTEMARQISYDKQHIVIEDETGEARLYLNKPIDQHILNIERFVEAVERDDGFEFQFKPDRFEVMHPSDPTDSGQLTFFMKQLQYWQHETYAEFEYSVNATVFFAAEREIYPVRGHQGGNYQDEFHRFNALIALIRSEVRSTDIRKKRSERERQARNNYESAHDRIQQHFDVCSRILIVRVDLYYPPQVWENMELPLENIKRDFRRFLNNRRCNSLFEYQIGLIWKLEYGIKKGYHYHCLFLFDGSKECNDTNLGQQIGLYWQNQITGGQGTFYNANTANAKKGFEIKGKLGIGMVSHDDVQTRGNLETILEYMTKKDQYLRIKLSKKARVFSAGEKPKPRTTKAGRPRASTVSV